jgi:hypothetical protein
VKRALLGAAAALAVSAPAALAVPPTITPAVTGPEGDNGWYVGNVIVNWTVTPPGWVDLGCPSSTQIKTDTQGARVTCHVENTAGEEASSSVIIRLDKTDPVVVANPDRPADAGGFYNHALTVTWRGNDPTSGIASCTSLPYGGPDGTGISLAGTCSDQAGNVSTSTSFAFNYDATPPTLEQLHANAEDHSVILSWQASGATQIVVTRSVPGARAAQAGVVVYSGTGAGFTDAGLSNGAKYAYTVQALDPAANVASASIEVIPSAAASSVPLLSPRPRAELKRPPLLRWRPIRVASYYNVQLYRHGKKILSTWPRLAHYQVRSKWRYRGHRYKLDKGKYYWYVWGGYGHRSEHRYGKLLGKRSFKIT